MAEHPAYPKADVVRQERVRRGSLLVGLAVVIFLAIVPLAGHHPFGLDTHMQGRDHLWALCLVALNVILSPVYGLFHLLLAAGLTYATWDRLRASLSAESTLRSVTADQPRPGDAFWRAAQRAGVDPNRIRAVQGLPDPAFTAGWLRPLIYVARELPLHLSPDELAAVLAHENAHVARRDPLRLSVLRFLRCTLFWLPALGPLVEDMADETEIQADDRATLKRPLVLARAIVKLAGWTPTARPLTGAIGYQRVGFQRTDLLDRRVRRLAGEQVSPTSRLTRGATFATAALLGVALLTAAAVSHPLSGDSAHASSHCDEHGSSPMFHLFCLGFVASREDCPHLHV